MSKFEDSMSDLLDSNQDVTDGIETLDSLDRVGIELLSHGSEPARISSKNKQSFSVRMGDIPPAVLNKAAVTIYDDVKSSVVLSPECLFDEEIYQTIQSHIASCTDANEIRFMIDMYETGNLWDIHEFVSMIRNCQGKTTARCNHLFNPVNTIISMFVDELQLGNRAALLFSHFAFIKTSPNKEAWHRLLNAAFRAAVKKGILTEEESAELISTPGKTLVACPSKES